MYINKDKQHVLRDLVTSCKVAAKQQGREVEGSEEWHKAWDTAEYSHKAFEALLGDSHALTTLQDMAQYNTEAEYALYRIQPFIAGA